MANVEACPICNRDECEHSDEERAEAARRGEGAPLVLSHDEPQQRRRKKAADKGELRHIEDLRAVLSIAHGRRFIWRMLVNAGLYQSSFARAEGPELVAHLCFYEGARNLGLELLNDCINHCKAEYALMVTENGGTK